MIAEWIIGLDAWAWFVFGAVLIGLELVVPGVFLLWLGLAAIATGLADGMAGLSWQASTLLFAGLSVIAVLVGRALSRPDIHTPTSSLNRRGADLIGRTFVLDAPMTAGEGRVRVDDSSWRVIGPDRPAGASVRVVRVEGATLVVEAAESSSR